MSIHTKVVSNPKKTLGFSELDIGDFFVFLDVGGFKATSKLCLKLRQNSYYWLDDGDRELPAQNQNVKLIEDISISYTLD